MTSRIMQRGGRRVRAFGSDVENIVCPAGTSANGDAQGNVWCQDANGVRVAASFTAAPAATVTGASQQASLGVAGWGVIIAGVLVAASFILKGRK